MTTHSGAQNQPPSPATLTDDDLYLFNEGSHLHLHHKLGSRLETVGGKAGARFAVWAPNAAGVHVMGDFNAWDRNSNPLTPRGGSGIWEGFIPGVEKGNRYKYHIVSRKNGHTGEKADPFGWYHEVPPNTASIVWDLDYHWNDGEWMRERAGRNALDAPISIYEVHIGSWMRMPEEGHRTISYRELAPRLADYVRQMGFTHVEFMPVMEHPFYGSWGYQTTGYFAPTSRFGTPQDFMHLVDVLHQNGIGVILDWVPSHFPVDAHGLACFDGTHLFEHADPRQGFHPDWKSAIFNYGRHEVRSFLASSAFFWLEQFHADGLRVDAVASMLYLDYSREGGEWIPNPSGGNENVEAIGFLRRLNEDVYKHFPDTQMMAEESTAWPMVSRPNYMGGLGFGMKWDMGWMHDMLGYMGREAVHRRYHQGDLTFRLLYAFQENFVLPLSHDEVVHGKGALIARMPGDYWQKFANLRALYGYMYAQPGKKLLFMGGEIAQWNEWNHDASIEWHLLRFPIHDGLQKWVEDLNRAYRDEPALHELDFTPDGFEWVDTSDADQSVISFLRMSRADGRAGEIPEVVLIVANLTPVPRMKYRIGVPRGGFWRELLNSDAQEYGGSGMGNMGGLAADTVAGHRRPYSLRMTLPPLSVSFFKSVGE